MLGTLVWLATVHGRFANDRDPSLVPFFAAGNGLTTGLRVVSLIVALEIALTVVVALACWLVIELAGILMEDQKTSPDRNHSAAQPASTEITFATSSVYRHNPRLQ